MTIGLEKAVAVYSVRALNSPPHPQVGTRRGAVRRRVNTTAGNSAAATTRPSAAGMTASNDPDVIPEPKRIPPASGCSPGNVRTTTMRAYPEAEYRKILGDLG